MQRLFEQTRAFTLLFAGIWALQLISCGPQKEMDQLNPLEELGRHLFFEPALSAQHTRSCGSCHDPQLAFTDGYRRSVSPQGDNLQHNAPSLLNTQTFHFYDWANPKATSYEQQIQRPLYGRHPVELGLDQHWEESKQHILNQHEYWILIKQAFPEKKPEDLIRAQVEQALVAYLKTLQAMNSPYDRFMAGDTNALNHSAQHGLRLFESKALACAQCHTPPLFTQVNKQQNLQEAYANIGLYNIRQHNQYPEEDPGLFASTTMECDHGKFRIPSLRNVALTAPYMHDGSVETLSEVLEHYRRGGRNINEGPHAGDGRLNKYKHPLIQGFELSPSEKRDLLEFLLSLTDTSYLQQERFSNPIRNKNSSKQTE